MRKRASSRLLVARKESSVPYDVVKPLPVPISACASRPMAASATACSVTLAKCKAFSFD